MAIAFPDIDPVALSLGPLVIRWYALAYVGGVLLGWWCVALLNKKGTPVLSKKAFDDIMVWVVVGIILGGRLGYVLFYNPAYYFSNPLEIPMLWHGGMSFHGGMIGSIVAVYLFCRKYQVEFWRLMDMVACVATIGLGLWRIANFINGELYGRVTTMPWGVIFPNGGPDPRHPSQLYEAFLEGAVMFLVLWILAWFTRIRQQPGFLCGLFLIFYANARIFVEFFREPDAQLGFLFEDMTMGQLLSLPMLVLGFILAFRAMRIKIPAL